MFSLPEKEKLYFSYLNGIKSFLTFNDLEFNAVFFTDSEASQASHVNEDVPVCVVFNDETVPFGFVEKFYSTCLHDNKNEKLNK